MEKTKLISRSVKYVPGLPYRQEVSASNSIKSTRPSMETSRLTGSTILGADFYNQMVHDLARALLGKVIVRQMDDGVLVKGRIVETEAYPGSTDPASHSFRGKTDRNAAMFDKAGTAYVYVIYGLYHCLNISSLEPGAGVLIRAIQPISGVDILRHFRAGGSTMKQSGLCSGPGRLCQALNITTSVFNKHDLHTGQSLWLEHDTVSSDFRVVEAPRIGINPKTHGEESVKRPWRYYVLGCPDVSRRDRQAELVHAPAAETVTAAAGNFGKMRKNSQRVGNKI